jgi:dTDP-4-amino-4,6-dideoxygalactose transaminase
MTDRIYLSSPDIGQAENDAVLRAMQSGWVAPLGPEVDQFEEEMAKRIGVTNAVALSSGTAALHLGLLALGVKPGDVVITATMTFVATANAILYTGATPFFIDCEIRTGNMDLELLGQAIELLHKQGKHIGAIVPVDLLGKAADYTTICAVAEQFGIPVLADSAESLGATHAGKPAGAWGEAAVLSFNGNKIMTTSGGGMLLTNNDEIAHQARHLATQAREPFVHYEHKEMGFNYRLSNILAALGRAQLSRLDGMIARRRELRESYRGLFAEVSGTALFDGGSDQHDNCWLTAVVVDPAITGWSADDLSRHLSKAQIESRPLWKPMHLQPLFAGTDSLISGASENLFHRGVTLPSSSALTADQLAAVLRNISGFLEHSGK